jgi:glycosyltransferase involved in cell wall biosynthesis
MLSVVIATDESERELVPTLAALIPGAAAGAVREVIVADGGSRDQTAEVADIAGCRIIVSRAPLGERLRNAAATARAPWLMFLRVGTVPDPTWIGEAIGFAAQEQRNAGNAARAAVFRPAPVQGSIWTLLEVLTFLRVTLAGNHRPEQGLMIPRALYDALGGHRDGADPERDLLRRLGRRRIAVLRSRAAQSAPRH